MSEIKRLHATFRTRRKLEIKNTTYCCFFQLRPGNLPIATGVAFCRETLEYHGLHKEYNLKIKIVKSYRYERFALRSMVGNLAKFRLNV
jgi:hypothetical protein